MLVILLNCVTLGMFRPCEDIACDSQRCRILQVSTCVVREGAVPDLYNPDSARGLEPRGGGGDGVGGICPPFSQFQQPFVPISGL